MFLFQFLCPFFHLLATRHHLLAILISMVLWFLPKLALFNFACDIGYTLGFEIDTIFWMTGKAGVNFYTQIKTVTQQWKDSASESKINLAMPTSQKSWVRSLYCLWNLWTLINPVKRLSYILSKFLCK